MEKQKKYILTEDKIRPEYLKAKQAKCIANDTRRLLYYKNEFVHVSCPACGSGVSHKIFKKHGLLYVKCIACETVYVNPRPTPEILEKYYATSENYKYWNEYIFPASEQARRENIFRPRIRQLIKFCKKNNLKGGTLLEVGAGFGTFCEELKKTRFFQRVIAVEPNPELARTCKKRGIEVIEKPFEQLKLRRESIDIIVCFEVIEHLYSPANFIRDIYSILAPNGFIFLTCPNVKGFDMMILREMSEVFDNEHLNYFHPKSITHLLRINNFEIIELLTPGKLDAEIIRKQSLQGKIDLSTRLFLREVIIERWDEFGDMFQRFLTDTLFSSHMWVIAQKITKPHLEKEKNERVN